ncbi:lantibiotic dehydratase [Actinomycetota bacterium Odt1-20B]
MTEHDPHAHSVELGTTGWRVWRDAVLRTAGFPADGLTRFSAPDCAEVTDRHLAGAGTREEFETAFGRATEHCAREIGAVAADPLLREAMTWQNRGALTLLDSLRRGGPTPRRNTTRRRREQDLSRYWQRYCGKAETIGFFGPSAWVRVDPGATAITLSPGSTMLARRQVFFEPWALTAFGAWLAEDPGIRAWLPPTLHPHLAVEGQRLLRQGASPIRLTPAQAAVAALCDGETPAAVIAERLLAAPYLAAAPDPDTGLRRAEDVHRILTQLARRRLIAWDANLPTDARAETAVRRRLAAIGDPVAAARARAAFARLCVARDDVAAAAGDSDRLAAALDALDREFTALTRREPSRARGKTYAGRGLCYEDTTRDVGLTIGSDFLDRLAPPLSLVLQATRWFSAELVDTYDRELTKLFDKAATATATTPDAPGPEVTLADLWRPALRLFWNNDRRPVDDVTDEFARRWHTLLGLNQGGSRGGSRDTSTVRLSSAELAPEARRLFAAERPGWSLARIHSPDLQICAESAEAVDEGAYEVVLGEMHACAPTLLVNLFTWSADDPAFAGRQAHCDYRAPRVVPLLPATWPRSTGRMVPAEVIESDLLLGFAPAPGVDRRRLVPVSAVRLRRDDEAAKVRAVLPDGQELPLTELFGVFLTLIAVDAYKTVTHGAHLPRVVVDDLVLFRETWRTGVDAVALPKRSKSAGGSEREDYLAVRRWRAGLGLPERVFIKVEGEMKPVYVDFTSPVYVGSLCTLLRAAQRRCGPEADAELVVSEALPGPGHAWVHDAQGRRYVSELRLHVVDPA